ncbi:hypothetical protein ACFWHQ_39345 [Streptomyces sp. NPDC060334]|uniref:hypothetical protein n=1 Tax=Streptomyces sp. NPDC060334 TaxID=3347099 RepID=UPI00364733A3
MEELRFGGPIGSIAIGHRDEGFMLLKGFGAHTLRLVLEVKAPPTEEAGRLLLLEAELDAAYGPHDGRALLGTATASVAFHTDEVRKADLYFTLTSAQLRGLDEQRSGELRLELQVRGILPQTTAYPGSSPVTLFINVAESRWRQHLEGLGPTLGVDLSVPFPANDELLQEAVGYLRQAQRRLRDNDVDAAMLDARRALEYIDENSGWPMPSSKKLKNQFTQAERWAAIRKALEDQTSGALHKDAVTKTFSYTRTEVETVIAMAAALLRLL